MRGRSKLGGWELYPKNMNGQAFETHEYNLESYYAQLKDDSARLFCPCINKISVTCLSNGNSNATAKTLQVPMKTPAALEVYLEDLEEEYGTQVLLIAQQGSWGHLLVDGGSMKKILTRFAVFPRFIDILRSFGQHTGFEGDSFGGTFQRNDPRNAVSETCYIVKHVERHGRPERDDPWSIRQTGVYYRRSGSSNHAFIILNPSLSLRSRLNSMQENEIQSSPQALHEMVLSCSAENWRWYISDLEKMYFEKKAKAQLTSVDEEEAAFQLSSVADLQITDTQDIQVLQDKCHEAGHALDIDTAVLGQLHTSSTSASVGNDSKAAMEADCMLSLFNETIAHVKRLERLLKRLDGTIALTRTILDFRCLYSVQKNSTLMATMAKLAQDENERIVELTSKATRDTDIMKWITLLTLVYLPASFVSSMMGMDYIAVQSSGKSFSIHFAGEFWVFMFLTGVLLLFTFLVYFWYSRRSHSFAERTEKIYKLG